VILVTMKIIFWLSFILILYTYFGYPLILVLLNLVKRKRSITKKEIYPRVSLIITAFNEEKHIAEKIKNSLHLDYPGEQLEIIAVSDGSTDRTNEILKELSSSGVKLIILNEQQGKTAAQNIAVSQAGGEILVFTDANSIFERNALKNLIRNFADEQIGGVCGELLYVQEGGDDTSSGENIYWKLEKFIKKNESSLFSTLGANGAIYAIRKNMFTSLPGDIISDLIQGLQVVKKRKRMIYEKEARATERYRKDYREEFRRKQRIITRSLYSLLRYKEFFNPLKYGVISFELFSHKLFRWFIPFFLVVIFISNIFLEQSLFFKLFLYFQIAFYIVSLLTFIFNIKSRYFYIIFYFCFVNLASFISIFKVAAGKKIVYWKPFRVEGEEN